MSGVPTESLLRALRRLIEIHKGVSPPRTGVPRIVPISLMERERWRHLIADVLSQEDGTLLDSTDFESGARAGDLAAEAPDLLAAVGRLLASYNTRDASANLTLEFDGGDVRVVGSQDPMAVNTGQGVLRDLVSALCSDRLRATDLVAISYPEEPLDQDTKREVWELLMTLPRLIGPRPDLTLAVISGDSRPDYNLHCTGNPSLTYVLNSSGLRERRSWRSNVFDVEDLGRHEKSSMPLLVLFLGAGASAGHGLPLGDSVRNRALSALTREPVDFGNFATVATDYFHYLAEVGKLSESEIRAGASVWVAGLTLERVIAIEQGLENQRMSSTLKRFRDEHDQVIALLRTRTGPDSLRELLAVQQRIVIVTVNFDHVIETRAAGLVRPIVTENEMNGFQSILDEYIANGGPVPLLKMHGDIHNEDTLVANLEETTAGLSVPRSRALQYLVSAVSAQEQRPWWYVGYSMRDADLMNTWTSPSFVSSVNEHWVSPFLDANVNSFIDTYRLRTWRENGQSFTAHDRSVTLTSEDFYQMLLARVVRGWA